MSQIKLIVGLANPGAKYEGTRHNAGEWLVNELARMYNTSLKEEAKYFGKVAKINTAQGEVRLLVPTTFMNLSGKALLEFINFFKIDKNKIIIIYDDKDLDVGTIRIRKNGSSGGHNGIKSIIAETGTQEFDRIKIGIGRPQKGMTVVNHVLGKFSEDDYATILLTLDKVETALNHYLKTNDFEDTMRRYNG